MNINSSFRQVLPVGVAILACIALAVWIAARPGSRFVERVPGTDGSASGGAPGESGVWKGQLIKSNGTPASLQGIWNQFRGPNRDGISTETIPLAKTWPSGGPKPLWKIDVGEGYAGGVIWKGRVLMLDYDKTNRADAIRAFSLADGKEIWRYTYPVRIKRNHGMSRTIPTLTDKYSISLGPKCNVVCIDVATGELKWQLDMVREFGTEVPQWYAGQCPFVDGDKLILGAGGPEALVAAVDVNSGKTLWKSPNPNKWAMTHSSVSVMDFNGKRQYLYCASGGVVAVSAEDGKILWECPDWKISMANIPCPLVIDKDRVFLSGGYNAGSMMLQLTETAGKISVKQLFRLNANVFGATQHTPILYHDHIFGVRADGQLVCLDLNGKIKWESGPKNKFGNGPLMIVQDMFYVMNDDGLLTLAAVSTEKYTPLAQAKVLEGPDAWAPMALADGHLVLRDMNQMICLDVK